MENEQFSDAVDAYLADTASQWQKFIIEDWCNTCKEKYDIEEIYNDAVSKGIGDRIFALINKIWNQHKRGL